MQIELYQDGKSANLKDRFIVEFRSAEMRRLAWRTPAGLGASMATPSIIETNRYPTNAFVETAVEPSFTVGIWKFGSLHGPDFTQVKDNAQCRSE